MRNRWIIVVSFVFFGAIMFSVSRAFHLTRSRMTPCVHHRFKMTSKREPEVSTLSLHEGDFQIKIRDLKKLKAPQKILDTVKSVSGSLTPNMSFTAMKALTNLERVDMLPLMVPFWEASARKIESRDDFLVATSVVRLYCRLGLVDLAEDLAAGVGVSILETKPPPTIPLLCYTSMLPELALGFITQGSVHKANSCLNTMKTLQLTMETDIAKKILKQFLQRARPYAIRKALSLILDLNDLDDHESVQMLTNYYIRTVEFVKGAVSMATLPEVTCPEVCFIGRSNVGKSSLINMICNRKSLAFTSKSPGKTSEFNYFEAKGVVGVDKEEHLFHLVDLPGVGFARKDKALRERWAKLLQTYTADRAELRSVYHLIDSRHGILDADEECFSLLECLPHHVQYVVVLTKADKHKDTDKGNKELQGVMARVKEEVQKRTDREIQIVLTSSNTRRGGVRILSSVINALAIHPEIEASIDTNTLN